MAMTTCKECGKQVSTEAKACPHCGATAPAKKKSTGGIGKWLLIVFAIGIVAAVLPKKDRVAASSSAPRDYGGAAQRKRWTRRLKLLQHPTQINASIEARLWPGCTLRTSRRWRMLM